MTHEVVNLFQWFPIENAEWTVGLETKSSRTLPLTCGKKYDMT